MNVTENCVICHDLGTLQWMDLCWGGWSWVCDDQDWELRIRHRQMDSQRLIQRNKNLKAGWQPKSHPFFCHILLMSASLRGPKKRYFLWSLEVFAHQKVSPLSPRRSRRQISTRSSIWNSNERKRPSVPSCPNRSTPNGFWMNMILPQWLAVPPWESCNKQQLDFWFSTFFGFLDVCLLIFAVRILIRPTTVFPLDRSFEACFCAARIKSCSHPQNWKTQTKMCKDMRELQVDFPPVDFPVVRTRHNYTWHRPQNHPLHPGCQPWVASNGRVLAFQRTTCLPVASPRAWSKPLDHGRKVRSSWPNDVGRMQMHRFYGWWFQGVVFFVFQTCWMVIKLGWHG